MSSKRRQSQKRTLLAIFGPVCYLCRQSFGEKKLTLDHVTAKIKGGKSNLSNLRLACYPCNQRKGCEDLPAPNDYVTLKIVVE